MIFYFVVRYRPPDEPVAANLLWPAIMVGLAAAAFRRFTFR